MLWEKLRHLFFRFETPAWEEGEEEEEKEEEEDEVESGRKRNW